jgi:hypothetical protein
MKRAHAVRWSGDAAASELIVALSGALFSAPDAVAVSHLRIIIAVWQVGK